MDYLTMDNNLRYLSPMSNALIPSPSLNRAQFMLMALVLLIFTFMIGSCASVDVVRLKPDQLHTLKGMEPVAGIQATCWGFYLFTLGLPDADLDKAVNELLMKEAKKIGADRVVDLHFDATPSHGIWWLTKLFFFRSATAWGIAIRSESNGEEQDAASRDTTSLRSSKIVSNKVQPPKTAPRLSP